MATYFHGNTEMQGNGDGLQTLILMNPAFVGYADNQHHLPPPPPATNFIFLNSSSSSANASQTHHLAGIPLHAAASSPQHQDVSELHGGGGGSLPRFHYNLYNPVINGGAAREVTRAKQGLSLSLSSQQPAGAAPSQTEAPLRGAEEHRAPANAVLSCKYLKVAQQLLDEVVNIGKEVKNGKEENGQPKNTEQPSPAAAGDGRAKRGAEITTAEKQEIQMKKAKLVDMLDEVEQRYKQYEQQMQMVIRWFEGAAGVGSAKAYTALALQTISKQFRCLKDAILSQIQGASRSLGEEEDQEENGKLEVSRLKFIDKQPSFGFRMIQNNAWRPQRGLPERSVSVLRAWLFQHFLHPYPKDTDKIMLAKQAGLTRSQVSNWFINARVRLWKPMVEEMYAEEMKAQQTNDDTEEKQPSTSKSTHQNNTTSPSPNNNHLGMGSSEMDSIVMQGRKRSPKKPRNAESQEFIQPANFFGTYPALGFQQPYSTNGVSLTLGLQHCENFMPNTSVEAAQVTVGDFAGFGDHAHTSAVYDNIDVHNSKRFAAHLLQDFVT